MLITGMSIAAVGLGAILVTATTTALAQFGADEARVGSGIINTFHELGGALGVAAVSSIAAPAWSPLRSAQRASPGHSPSTSSPR